MEAERQSHEPTNAQIQDLVYRCLPIIRAWLLEVNCDLDPDLLANRLGIRFGSGDHEAPDELGQCDAAVYGRNAFPPAAGNTGLGVGGTLFHAIQAFLTTEEVVALGPVHKDRVERYLYRFRAALAGEDPGLLDVTPNVVATYFGGPRLPIAKARESLGTVRAFLEWCVRWEMLTSTVLAEFREWHPVFGKYTRYRRGKSAGEATP